MKRLALLVALLPMPAMADGAFNLRIGTSASSQMTPNYATDILAQVAGQIGRFCDPPTVTLAGLGAYSNPKLAIYTAKNYAETKPYRDSGYSVHIVDQILQCGRLDMASLAGCAYEGGPIIIKRQGSLENYALLIAHEIGHAQGLVWADSSGHPAYKDGHNTKFARLMNGSPWAWKLDGAECTKMLGPQAFAAGGGSQGDDTDPAPTPRDYLMAPWSHGPDLAVISTMSEALTAAAIVAVQENDFALWPNAATLLGVTQPPPAVDLLVKLIRHPAAGLSAETGFHVNEARSNALIALGYLVHTGRFSGIEEIAFLRDYLDPEQNAEVIDFGDVAAEERASLAGIIALRAMMALALSPTEMALASLNNQREAVQAGDITLPVDDGFFDDLQSLAQAARTMPLQQLLTRPQDR